MPNTTFRTIPKSLPVMLITVLTFSSLFPAAGHAALLDDPPAQILAIIVNDSVVNKPQGDQVVITRSADGGCPPVTDIMKGLPLCKGDRVNTTRNVRVKIAYGDPKNRDEIIIGSTTAPSEITIASAHCGLVCQLFCRYANRFSNRRQRVTFANRGTVYELRGEQDASARLLVYEGQVDVIKDQEPSATSTPSETNAPEPATGAADGVRVDSLSMALLDAEGNITELRKLEQKDVCKHLAASTATEIALHATPAEAGGNFAKYVNYQDIATRNDKFESARCDSFWSPKLIRPLLDLAKVYNDWGDAEQALIYLAKATELYGGLVSDDELRLNKGIALRQTGKYQEALAELDQVISDADSLYAADALNIRGSIFYDQARKLMLASQTDEATVSAAALLQQAESEYEKAEQRRPTSLALQYIRVNKAQVSKAQGDIAKRRGDYSAGALSYIRAIGNIGAAYGDTDNPKNKIAGLFVARARAALADAYAAMGDSKSFETYKKAENTYKASIEEAERQHQKFAQSYCGLASLYLILGDDKARENYDKCVAYNIAALVTETEVPTVVGLRRPNAIQLLAEAGLEPEIVKDGELVESQEPQSGQIKIGTKVKLTLRIPERE